MFKNLSNIAALMKQAGSMNERMKTLGDELRAKRVTGTAGGGLVEVEMNGAGEVLRLKIDPTLIEKGDREMIEDLVPAALNQAHAKARELHAEAMQDMTSGIDLPGMSEALAKFTGGS